MAREHISDSLLEVISSITDSKLRDDMTNYHKVAEGKASSTEVDSLHRSLLHRFCAVSPYSFFHPDDLGTRRAKRQRETFVHVLDMLKNARTRQDKVIALDSAISLAHKNSLVIEGVYPGISYADKLKLGETLDRLAEE